MALTPPRLVTNADPCGGSLTKASVKPLTMDLIEAMGDIEYNQERLLARMLESRAVGVVQNTLEDLLNSRIRKVHKNELQSKNVQMQSIIAPFKYRRRERNFKSGDFNVDSGTATPGAGSNGIPASSWRITVNLGYAQFQSPLQDIERYFLPGNYLNIEHEDGSNNKLTTVHKIVAAGVGTTANTAIVDIAALFNDTDWGNLTSGQKAVYQPVHGLISLLTNNVSDYESWCYNQPTNNNNELVVDWIQTTRFSRCTTKEFEEQLIRILNGEVNSFQKNFKVLEVAKRNKQMREEYNRQLMNTVFYGQRISQYQVDNLAAANFEKLEAVTDPEDPTSILEYKAGAVGIRTQLAENGRVVDLQGGTINLDDFFEWLYFVRRHRRLDNMEHDVIDMFTDRKTKDKWDQTIIRWLKARYGSEITRYVESGKTLVDGTNFVQFDYTVYDIPNHHFRLAIFTHAFFDDRIDAMSPGHKNIGRQIWVIDWFDIYRGLISTNTAKREYKGETTANANSTWSCVMKMNTKYFDLESETWCVEIGDYNRHLIVENFADACPSLTVDACDPTS